MKIQKNPQKLSSMSMILTLNLVPEVKPTKNDMRSLEKKSESQFKRLYKVFGDKIKQDEDQKEEDVKAYQKELENRVFEPVGGQLRDYQAEGVSWLMSNHLNKRSSILADEMGLGCVNHECFRHLLCAVFISSCTTN